MEETIFYGQVIDNLMSVGGMGEVIRYWYVLPRELDVGILYTESGTLITGLVKVSVLADHNPKKNTYYCFKGELRKGLSIGVLFFPSKIIEGPYA